MCTAAYVTHEDLCQRFKDNTLLAVQAPSGTTLEVPIPDGIAVGGGPVGPPDLRVSGLCSILAICDVYSRGSLLPALCACRH